MSNANLQALQAVERDLSLDQCMSLASHMLGWLSGVVGETEWAAALEESRRFATRSAS